MGWKNVPVFSPIECLVSAMWLEVVFGRPFFAMKISLRSGVERKCRYYIYEGPPYYKWLYTTEVNFCLNLQIIASTNTFEVMLCSAHSRFFLLKVSGQIASGLTMSYGVARLRQVHLIQRITYTYRKIVFCSMDYISVLYIFNKTLIIKLP